MTTRSTHSLWCKSRIPVYKIAVQIPTTEGSPAKDLLLQMHRYDIYSFSRTSPLIAVFSHPPVASGQYPSERRSVEPLVALTDHLSCWSTGAFSAIGAKPTSTLPLTPMTTATRGEKPRSGLLSRIKSKGIEDD